MKNQISSFEKRRKIIKVGTIVFSLLLALTCALFISGLAIGNGMVPGDGLLPDLAILGMASHAESTMGSSELSNLIVTLYRVWAAAIAFAVISWFVWAVASVFYFAELKKDEFFKNLAFSAFVSIFLGGPLFLMFLEKKLSKNQDHNLKV